jgi:hypothetical protein
MCALGEMPDKDSMKIGLLVAGKNLKDYQVKSARLIQSDSTLSLAHKL